MVRAYTAGDVDALWALKRAFELDMGAEGDAEREARYVEKLTGSYRHRYFGWVSRCTAANPRSITVAEASDDDQDSLAGYVFVLPESMAMIWDAAVLNELYVRPEYRGTGVADDLLKAALSVAREQDLPLDRMVLDVAPTNERAMAFYRKHGFSEWGEMVAREL